jgi:hypothetical protein
MNEKHQFQATGGGIGTDLATDYGFSGSGSGNYRHSSVALSELEIEIFDQLILVGRRAGGWRGAGSECIEDGGESIACSQNRATRNLMYYSRDILAIALLPS